MSGKIIKDRNLNPKRLRSFDLPLYEDVERGEKEFEYSKVGEMEYTPGEIRYKVSSFDEDVELRRAVVVQDAQFNTEKYVPESFDEEPKEMIVAAEPEPEEEPEPEQPAISEEELEAIRREAYQKGMAEGISRGMAEGEEKAKKAYEAERSDYLAGLQNTYNQVISQVKIYKEAVEQLDDELPQMLESMVTDIIGAERKVNEDVIVSVTKNSLKHLKDMEKVVFLVNPDDVDTMNTAFPDYETAADRHVQRGSLKVQTNIGELDFSIDRMLKDFLERIHEEFSQTEADRQ